MKHIGIVCEGPTDYVILKRVIDQILGEINTYVMLQPESDLTGKYGNGWKGVWKWCHDNAPIQKQLMLDVQPSLDFLVIQMDGDVSRKEKSVHCQCKTTQCVHKGYRNPLDCDTTPETRQACPIILPCKNHIKSVEGYVTHLKTLLVTWLNCPEDTCIAIPCDSTEAWIAAAYDQTPGIESVPDPWAHIIARSKSYHGIRIPGRKKRVRVFEQFAPTVCKNWDKVTELCQSAKDFEDTLRTLAKAP